MSVKERRRALEVARLRSEGRKYAAEMFDLEDWELEKFARECVKGGVLKAYKCEGVTHTLTFEGRHIHEALCLIDDEGGVVAEVKQEDGDTHFHVYHEPDLRTLLRAYFNNGCDFTGVVLYVNEDDELSFRPEVGE